MSSDPRARKSRGPVHREDLIVVVVIVVIALCAGEECDLTRRGDDVLDECGVSEFRGEDRV